MRALACGLLVLCAGVVLVSFGSRGTLLAGDRRKEPTEAAPGDAIKKEMKKLEGTWVVESVTEDGKPAQSEEENQFIFAGAKLTLKQSKKPTGFVETEMTYKIDPVQKPKAIDFALEKAKPDTPAIKGIYQLEADKLKLCFGRSGKRPKEMSDNGQLLFILKRKKG
jgi:uncharacterized protein (TIGR03067 family)